VCFLCVRPQFFCHTYLLLTLFLCAQTLAYDIDLLHPPTEEQKQKHKLKRLVQSPNSFFMDVKCQGCFQM
jgi:hypothetical protein